MVEVLKDITEGVENISISNEVRSDTSPAESNSESAPASHDEDNAQPAPTSPVKANVQPAPASTVEANMKPTPITSSVSSRLSFNSYVTGIPGNYVGLLQELSVSRHWPMPSYSEGLSIGPSHTPTFTIDCMLGDNMVSGTSSSKKAAKQEAAKKMLETVRTSGFRIRKATVGSLANSNTINNHSSGNLLNGFVENQPPTSNLMSMETLRERLKGDTLKSLTVEMLLNENLDYQSLLKKVCEEESISYHYWDVFTDGAGKKCCAVVLEIPQCIIASQGVDTDEEAKSNAAKMTLVLMKSKCQ